MQQADLVNTGSERGDIAGFDAEPLADLDAADRNRNGLAGRFAVGLLGGIRGASGFPFVTRPSADFHRHGFGFSGHGG